MIFSENQLGVSAAARCDLICHHARKFIVSLVSFFFLPPQTDRSDQTTTASCSETLHTASAATHLMGPVSLFCVFVASWCNFSFPSLRLTIATPDNTICHIVSGQQPQELLGTAAVRVSVPVWNPSHQNKIIKKKKNHLRLPL